MAWPNVILSVLAWAASSRIQMRPEGRASPPPPNWVRLTLSTSPMAPLSTIRRISRYSAEWRACRPTHVADARGGGKVGHLLGLGRGRAERPLGVDVLARRDDVLRQFVVGGQPDDDGRDIDLRVREEVVVVVVGVPRAELRRGLVRRLLSCGGDRDEFDAGDARRHRGHVGASRPAVHVPADDANPDVLCHVPRSVPSRISRTQPCYAGRASRATGADQESQRAPKSDTLGRRPTSKRPHCLDILGRLGLGVSQAVACFLRPRNQQSHAFQIWRPEP